MGSHVSGRMIVVASGLLFLIGCAENTPPVATEPQIAYPPIGEQLKRVAPQLSETRFSNLLNFETSGETVFVTPSRVQMETDDLRAHTGKTSLRLTGDGGKIEVKLSSLLGSQQFPGEWTQIGGYFLSDHPGRIAVTVNVDAIPQVSTTIEVPAGRWTPVFIDLPLTLGTGGAPGSTVKSIPSLSFSIGAPGDVWCDDVMLIDNSQWIVGQPQTARDKQWSVYRRGSNFVCSAGRFSLPLLAIEASPDGWTLEEANNIRARFSAAKGAKTLTVYPDGRSYWDGQYRAIAPELRSEPLWGQQQLAPAQIEIPETMGRMNRNSPGDNDNDGYNESRAAYTIVSAGPRMEFQIIPRTAPALQPMLEISNLPPGEAMVTVEGKLVERSVRLPDGTLLVAVPGQIERPTAVNVRVQ